LVFYWQNMFSNIKDELEILMTAYHGKVGLFLSGGSDSLLLLHILLDLKKEFSIVVFDHSFNREQKKHIAGIIRKFDLTVFSYPPMNAYLIGDGKQVSVVEEYKMIDGSIKPFVKDIVHNEKICAMEDVDFSPFCEVAPIGFALNLLGIRKADRHYTTGRVANAKTTKTGNGIYYYPLWDLTRKDVKEGLKYYQAEYPKIGTGEISLCLECLCPKGDKVFCPKYQTEIPKHNWDAKENLRLFQEKFNYSRS